MLEFITGAHRRRGGGVVYREQFDAAALKAWLEGASGTRDVLAAIGS
ncbi:MAG: hypothetical protein ACE10E_05855 [Acidiferrobacterales bacterium]|nr:hypothetical protein [Gammaproteobacteria bacterium]